MAPASIHKWDEFFSGTAIVRVAGKLLGQPGLFAAGFGVEEEGKEAAEEHARRVRGGEARAECREDGAAVDRVAHGTVDAVTHERGVILRVRQRRQVRAEGTEPR